MMYDFIDYIKFLFIILTVNHAKCYDAYKYHMCKFLINSVKKLLVFYLIIRAFRTDAKLRLLTKIDFNVLRLVSLCEKI